jgi:hypothetical protein
MNGRQQLITGAAKGVVVPIAIGRDGNVCEKYTVKL